MKRRLLTVCGAFLFGVLGMKQVKAQDYQLSFSNYTSSQLNTWKGSGAASTNVPSSANGIKAYFAPKILGVYNPSTGIDISNRPNNVSFGADDGFMRGRMDNNDIVITIEKPATGDPLVKVALQYNIAGAEIVYGELPPDTTGLGQEIGRVLLEDWRSTLTPKSGAVQPSADFPAPGGIVYFDVSDQDTRYVEIRRNTGGQTRLFRIAASTTDFTLTPITLPVKLTSFTASLSKSGVLKADWKTASETKNSHFILQSSTDGESWKDLVRKDADPNGAAGATYNVETFIGGFSLAGFGLLSILLLPFSNKRYRILTMLALIGIVVASCAKDGDINKAELLNNDKGNSKDVIYLRLAQVDLDGTTEYSEILTVKAK